MSDKTIAAMTLALEALNSIDVGYRSSSGDALEVSFDEAKCEAAIAALREALAKQRLTNMQQKMERSIEFLEAALVQEQTAQAIRARDAA